ncbi:hypothetical protein QFZ79_001518 [Arthrobacter sp. V4I6]|uniref:hypothetical protein n=1 Tax=unclassified Arthrobacter TaxID=235627 RepID=UPI0027846A49|nr:MULTISPECIES: hypothetical protein [unclassified Arthrobacter]MDQ0819223.1 hypothetical protein [Arthrobacter sp. V1I7]MDQ0853407.1 hypothetical protein [Arthrobacter sp. V4I6]
MEPMDCLIIYVPIDAADAVRPAIDDAGTGRLGNYSHRPAGHCAAARHESEGGM